MIQLTPYLTFETNCREAMEFYRDIFGGELFIQSVGESPMAKDMAGMEDRIMHAALRHPSFLLMASDACMPGQKYMKGNDITLTLGGDSSDEQTLRDYFAKLAVGGNIHMPMEKQFWGDLYGEVIDKFGMRWMFNCKQA